MCMQVMTAFIFVNFIAQESITILSSERERMGIISCIYGIKALFLFRLAMIEQERRDRELALRLAQGPEALDAEAQQAPQLPLQRCKHRVD